MVTQDFTWSKLAILTWSLLKKYSFLQSASCFVEYMAAMTFHDNNITHVCVCHSQSQQRCQLPPELNKDWSAIDTSLFSQCFMRRARKALARLYQLQLLQTWFSARARKASAQPMRTSKAFIRNNKTKGWMYASTGTYNRPCHTKPCHYKHGCIKCFPEEHSHMDCPKRLKKGPSRRQTISGLNSQRNNHLLQLSLV